MSIYNEIEGVLICPRCGLESKMTINLYFGERNLIRYELGNKCKWTSSPMVENGGRPEAGNLQGEGYTQCPRCDKDFFVLVEIKDDVFVGFQPDPSKKPHIE